MEADPCSPQFRSPILLSHHISPTLTWQSPWSSHPRFPPSGTTFTVEDLTKKQQQKQIRRRPLSLCEGESSPYPPTSVIYIKILNKSQLASSSYQTSDEEASSNILTSHCASLRTFSRTEMPTSGLLIRSSLKPLFPPPRSMSSLTIELKVPPGA